MTRTARILLALTAPLSPLAAQWTVASPTNIPGARTSQMMAKDATGNVVMFGGVDLSVFPAVNFADTWRWNGTDWTQLNPTPSPTSRSFSGMAYDVFRGRTVMYGGQATSLIGGSYRNETWEWDGTNWIPVTTANTPGSLLGNANGISQVAMAYDLQGQRIVMFGGEVFQGFVPANNLTLEYDGVNWVRTIQAVRPSPRAQASMCSAPSLGGVLLFGGTNFNNPSGPNGEIDWNDTWVYSASNDTWTRLQPTGVLPPARAGASLFFDPTIGRYVLHGGYFSTAIGTTTLTDTWWFDGTTWVDVSAGVGAPTGPRVRFRACEGPNGIGVLFGGASSFNTAAFGDTWRWGGVALATSYGTGCIGSTGIPSLSSTGRPVVGTNYTLVGANLGVASSFAFLMAGFSDTTSALGALPLSLQPFGLGSNCFLLQSAQSTLLVPVASGTCNVLLTLPATPGLNGLQLFHQLGALDASATGGIAVSNGLRSFLGLY